MISMKGINCMKSNKIENFNIPKKIQIVIPVINY